MTAEERNEILEQVERYLEGRLTEAERDAFEARVAELNAYELVADQLHLHGTLSAQAGDWLNEAGDDSRGNTSSENKVVAFPNRQWWHVAVGYAAVVTVTAVSTWWLLHPAKYANTVEAPRLPIEEAKPETVAPSPVTPPVQDAPAKPVEETVAEASKKDATVARLADTRACKWGSGTLPTAQGARLAPGRLSLLEGLAAIQFDGGASLNLEGPVEIEIESAKRCRLIQGAAVAWVPERARGFQIVTNDALLTDYGTRFGVTASDGGPSEVLVLEGEVGVAHSSLPDERRLFTGDLVRYDRDRLESVVGGADEVGRGPETHVKPEDGSWTVITTAMGRGRDNYIRKTEKPNPEFGRSPLVMSKWSTARDGNRRKAYLGFDLSRVRDREITEAELALEIRPSGLGYASLVEDSYFVVYGLTDETLDDWPEHQLHWDNAPANVEEAMGLNPEQTVPLGRFDIAQGVCSGTRTIKGPELAKFLNADTNGMVTFIIIRETDEMDSMGLVHAFASKEHPTAMPPTLRLKFDKENR